VAKGRRAGQVGHAAGGSGGSAPLRSLPDLEAAALGAALAECREGVDQLAELAGLRLLAQDPVAVRTAEPLGEPAALLCADSCP
jgi:hypothetical protein